MQKARDKGLVSFEFHNPRDFAKDKHKSVDDTVYGGGAGMLMALPPLVECIENYKSTLSKDKKIRYIALSPDGETFTQEKAKELSKDEEIVLLCGRYEGFDARIFELYPIEKISMGDYVLNGGEAAALCFIEATARLLPDFMSKEESHEDESFNNDLLECPHYTKPPSFNDLEVPKELLSGNHAEIAKYRKKESLKKTFYHRPDLLAQAPLEKEDIDYVKKLPHISIGRNLNLCLLHHPVLLKNGEAGSSSVTNLDIHDIARSACTYDCNSLFIVTPIEDQASLVNSIAGYWTKGQGARANHDRQDALSLVRHAYSFEETVKSIEEESGQKPFIVGTSAQIPKDKKGRALLSPMPFKELKKILKNRQILLLFGTSHGIPNFLLAQCDAILPPLRAFARYNHFSVRAAAALCLDRLIGEND